MLTVRETAQVLSLSRQTVINMLTSERLQGKKIPAPNASGYYWLIPESEIQRIKIEREGK